MYFFSKGYPLCLASVGELYILAQSSAFEPTIALDCADFCFHVQLTMQAGVVGYLALTAGLEHAKVENAKAS